MNSVKYSYCDRLSFIMAFNRVIPNMSLSTFISKVNVDNDMLVDPTAFLVFAVL